MNLPLVGTDLELDQRLARINQVWAVEHDRQTGRHLILTLPDGVTAPAAIEGKAQIYVDSADGDLKVVFGDGTVKTIVTDT
jgi:hypothetical protein